MTVNRNHFKRSYRDLPQWDCPTCGKGHLIVVPEKTAIEETGPSKRAHGHDDWDPDWIVERFAMLMKCNFASCGEIAAVSGDAYFDVCVDVDEEGLYQQKMVRHYEPFSILPAPWPIRPAKKTPDAVKEALKTAAALLWQSPEAAANQVRQAVEVLMDAQKVRKNQKTARKPLTLHARILEFGKKDVTNSEILRAVKWIGNDGSHKGGLKREDVLDAFDMIEMALSNLYDDTTTEILKKVRAVIKSKEKKQKPKKASPAHGQSVGAVTPASTTQPTNQTVSGSSSSTLKKPSASNP